ncbi:MAG: heparan-alpha-glucosaminide N-acetyltransferase domain-containing protein [Nonlabens sp.]
MNKTHATDRLYFIDAARAIAIILMLQGHFVDTLLAQRWRDSSSLIYSLWEDLRGFTAPLFFTVAGLIFSYLIFNTGSHRDPRKRIYKGYKRAAQLVAIGYLLNIPYLNWAQGIYDTEYLNVGVLQIIGCGVFLLALLHRLLIHNRLMLMLINLGLGLTIFFLEPLYRDLVIPDCPLFLLNYLSKINGSGFVLFPWLGYIFIGAALGNLLSLTPTTMMARNRFLWCTITTGTLLSLYSEQFLVSMASFTGHEIFTQIAYYNYLFPRLGAVLIFLAVLMGFNRFFKHSLWYRIGGNTLSIYIVHSIILYGSILGVGLSNWWYRSLNPPFVIIGAAVFIGVCLLITGWYVALDKKKFYRHIPSYGSKLAET